MMVAGMLSAMRRMMTVSYTHLDVYKRQVVKPQADGTLDINKMLDAVDKNTILVACMMVNRCV